MKKYPNKNNQVTQYKIHKQLTYMIMRSEVYDIPKLTQPYNNIIVI